ncbi:nucleolar and spindle-associated protein 1 [Cynoglossus semilaevis]|nr:nucleolar and spindle-associated protein 1 [Cynoglossus semilaevis]
MDIDVDSLKYAELQKHAKKLGLKANLKADKLLTLVKEHYQQKGIKNVEDEKRHVENAAVVQKKVEPEEDPSTEKNTEGLPCTAVFVNTRRGKGRNAKRKISNDKCDAKSTTNAVEVDHEVAVSVASKGGDHRAKKRRLSSINNSPENKLELPKDLQVTQDKEQQQQHEEADVNDDAPSEDTGTSTNGSKASKIPLQKRKKLKPQTPNFKKLHEAHFKKMESIDSYVQRKNKQMETYKAGAKELKSLSEQQQLNGKTQTKANQSRTSLFSPAPVSKIVSEDKCRKSMMLSGKTLALKAANKAEVPFRPSVLSTRKINVRFSKGTRENDHKTSFVKTPARFSPCVASSTPQQPTAVVKSTSVRTSVTKTPGVFVFTGNNSTLATPGTQKKAAFDLKASLSRPLGYKPHKGKLKPFGEVNENASVAANESQNANPHQKNYKQHQVKTREDRREKQVKERKEKKTNMLGARRGLVMM